MKNVNESGRSMVEMLGVLAIIGVLSIGGIAGYTRAMRNWRANEILDAANRTAAMVETEISTSNSITYDGVAGSGATAKVAGGVVDSITAYNSLHDTKPLKIEIVLKKGNDTIETAIEDKICTTTGTGQTATTNCVLSQTFTVDVSTKSS